jgi:hypothetical protein
MSGMQQALDTVQPAIAKFYNFADRRAKGALRPARSAPRLIEKSGSQRTRAAHRPTSFAVQIVEKLFRHDAHPGANIAAR